MAKVEQLEGRRLLSGAFSVVDGTLIVRGTSRADQIEFDYVVPVALFIEGAPAPRERIAVTLNGRRREFDASSIQRIRVEAGAGDDLVLLGRSPLTPSIFAPAGVALVPATLLGGDGDDTLVGGERGDLLVGGNGRDVLAGSYGNDTLDGGSGSDELLGQDGADVMLGGRGEDRFTLQGDDTVDGGLGNDLYAKVSPRGRAKVKNVEAALSGDVLPDAFFDGATLVVRGTPRADEFSSYREYFESPSRLSIKGDSIVSLEPVARISVNGDSVITLLAETFDRIRVVGGDGDDSILMGLPEDAAYIPELTPIGLPLELFGGAGNDTLRGWAGNDSLVGDDGDDLLIGNTGDDFLDGGAGNDTLRGNGGNDTLYGGTAGDSLDGGAGHDIVAGGADLDTLYGGADVDQFLSDDTDAERKDRTPDEGIIVRLGVPLPRGIALTFRS